MFRSRKWPEFFRVGLRDPESNEDNDRILEDRRIVPLLNVDINDKVLMSKQSLISSCAFNTGDPVMILNPAGRSMDELDLNNYYDNYDTSSLGDPNDQLALNMGDDCIKHQSTFTVTDI